MKIKISRSFSKKVQLKQFEPIDSFCAAEAEIDLDEVSFFTGDEAEEDLREKSAILDDFCRAEVEKTIAEIRAPLEKGKSKYERREATKDEAEHDNGDDL